MTISIAISLKIAVYTRVQYGFETVWFNMESMQGFPWSGFELCSFLWKWKIFLQSDVDIFGALSIRIIFRRINWFERKRRSRVYIKRCILRTCIWTGSIMMKYTERIHNREIIYIWMTREKHNYLIQKKRKNLLRHSYSRFDSRITRIPQLRSIFPLRLWVSRFKL